MLKAITPHRFFLWVSLGFGLIYIFLTPPLRSLDEERHFFHVYNLSQGKLVAQETVVPVSMMTMVKDYDRFAAENLKKIGALEKYASYLQKSLNTPLDSEGYRKIPVSSAAYYSPFPYLTAIPVAFISSFFNTSPLIMLYLLRITLWLSGVVLLYYAIKNIPFIPWHLALFSILPPAIAVRSGITADSLTIGYCALFVSLVLRKIADKTPLQKIDCILLAALAFALSASKALYFPLVFLLFFIPSCCFPSQKSKYFMATTISILCIVFAAGWMKTVPKLNPNSPELIERIHAVKDSAFAARFYPTITTAKTIGAAPDKQTAFLLSNPALFISIPILTPGIYTSMWGTELTGLLYKDYENIFVLPKAGALLILLLFLIPQHRAKNSLTPKERMGFLALFFVVYELLCITFYIGNSPFGYPIAVWIQGRYFIPLAPLLFLALTIVWGGDSKTPLAVNNTPLAHTDSSPHSFKGAQLAMLLAIFILFFATATCVLTLFPELMY
jgi:uncharacterized membrane protein